MSVWKRSIPGSRRRWRSRSELEWSARYVAAVTPGGFEGFFQDVADYEAAHGGELPGVERLVECLAGYGVQVLAPQ